MKTLDKGNGQWFYEWRMEPLAWPGKAYKYEQPGWIVLDFHVAPFVLFRVVRLLD